MKIKKNIDVFNQKPSIDNLIMKSLGLKKAEYKIFSFIIKKMPKFTIQSIAKALSLDRTTIQKVVKIFLSKNLLKRNKKTFSKGGYLFVYTIEEKNILKKRIKTTIKNQVLLINKEIDDW